MGATSRMLWSAGKLAILIDNRINKEVSGKYSTFAGLPYIPLNRIKFCWYLPNDVVSWSRDVNGAGIPRLGVIQLAEK